MMQIDLPATETTDRSYFQIGQALAALEKGEALSLPPLEVTRAVINQHEVLFCSNMRGFDPIQEEHRKGRFYEPDELARLTGMLPEGAHILDVGANVGNHTLYFARVSGAARVVPVEPNPLALAPLMGHIVLNRLENIVETGLLGIGLGAASEGGFGMKRHHVNLGATKMRPGTGKLEVHAGDDLLEGERFDLIKIDVEGMEMDVLAGLEATIAASRPLILIEVEDSHKDDFLAWAQAHSYRIDGDWRHSKRNQNYLISPAERDGAPQGA